MSRTNQYFLGIDPGLHGAIAIYIPQYPQLTQVWDMPIRDDCVDARELYQIMLRHVYGGRVFAVIERVSSLPRQAGAFNFGLYTGIAHGAVGAFGLPLNQVSPAAWKRSMGLTRSSADESQADMKTKARKLAAALFPNLATMFARVKDDGRAEALLLAVYYAHTILKIESCAVPEKA